MSKELTKFKRYCELLEIMYSMRTKPTGEEIAELNSLGYELELDGVPDIISEMNFNRLEKELERGFS